MTFRNIVGKLAVAMTLSAVTACGTAPNQQGDVEDPEGEVVAAEGAASADPGYRVRGATGLLDFGIDLF